MFVLLFFGMILLGWRRLLGFVYGKGDVEFEKGDFVWLRLGSEDLVEVSVGYKFLFCYLVRKM